MTSKKTHRRSPRFRHGNAMIEMVIVFPVLIGLGLGMAEFAEFFYVKTAFESAARDVARVSILATAQKTDPATRATATLAQSNVTFNSSWLTIVDNSTGSVVTDVSTVPAGDVLSFVIQQYYDQIPGVYRPLYQMTGKGIANGKLVLGECTAIKE
jgi:Flp pilus assembly protein TadG